MIELCCLRFRRDRELTVSRTGRSPYNSPCYRDHHRFRRVCTSLPQQHRFFHRHERRYLPSTTRILYILFPGYRPSSLPTFAGRDSRAGEWQQYAFPRRGEYEVYLRTMEDQGMDGDAE